VFSKRERPTADRLSCDESLVVQRVEQRTDDNGRDELEATEWLLRSSNRDVITIGVFHGDGAEHRITFKRRKEVVPAALATKRRTWKARGSNWLTVIACRQPGTEWRGVSPTTEGRRERPVAGGRDRTRATGPAATNRGSAATFRWWARPPPNVSHVPCGVAATYSGRRYQPFGDGRRGFLQSPTSVQVLLPPQGRASNRSRTTLECKCGFHLH
jgi:hypothetical protein